MLSEAKGDCAEARAVEKASQSFLETEREISEVERKIASTSNNAEASARLQEIEQALRKLMIEKGENQREVSQLS